MDPPLPSLVTTISPPSLSSPSSSSSSSPSSPSTHLSLRRRHWDLPRLKPFISSAGISLSHLDLSYNRLTSLPPLAHLPNLRHLNLAHNLLSSLPSSLEALGSLEVLIASGNRLTHLSPTLMTAWSGHLHTLILDANRLSHLPRSLSQCSHLRILRLGSVYGGNLLSSLPDSLISSLPLLRELDLSSNLLSTLPDLPWPPDLRSLDLSDNALTSLPPHLGQCRQLRALVASRNLLTTIPRSLALLTSLESLDLSGNRLSHLPGEVSWLARNGTIVLLSGNPGISTATARVDPPPPLPPPPPPTTTSSSSSSSSSLLPRRHPRSQRGRRPTLLELSARCLLRSSIPIPESSLPPRIRSYLLQGGGSCEGCKGPYVREWISAKRLGGFGGYPSLVRRVRYCSMTCGKVQGPPPPPPSPSPPLPLHLPQAPPTIITSRSPVVGRTDCGVGLGRCPSSATPPLSYQCTWCDPRIDPPSPPLQAHDSRRPSVPGKRKPRCDLTALNDW
ncbi:MAG: hypothetical protein DHS80DRAFT_25270 [Piptocephalis tieghemiana]|nr:MAG: hypothetical protein DHS80DRAFT_25270 [Piptocephalis tieghemiana]